MRDIRIQNSADGTKRAISNDETVRMYVCGLTVSDPPHLGHARAWAFADVIRRYSEYAGYDVKHVENLTDVNEKIVARAGTADGDDEQGVARTYTAQVLDAMRGLNLLPAHANPRVSHSIPDIIDFIETLIDNGHAYEANGSVYFDVTTFDEYGALSNQSVASLEPQGNEHEDVQNEKRNAADFALWKDGPVRDAALQEHVSDGRSVDDIPTRGQTWESPWGEGRPGWHIECSAMSARHLDLPLDIHLGGHDLTFPHHENEVAQTTAATGETFVRNWAHIGLLRVGDMNESEKMSSSEENFMTVADGLAEYGPDILRLFYYNAHYGSEQVLSEDALEEAQARYDTLSRGRTALTNALDSVDAVTEHRDPELHDAATRARSSIHSAMDDDFQTRDALNALTALAETVTSYVQTNETYDYKALLRAYDIFTTFAEDVFGLQFDTAEEAPDVVSTLIEQRNKLRDEGAYDAADAIRDALEAAGYTIEDGDDETTVR